MCRELGCTKALTPHPNPPLSAVRPQTKAAARAGPGAQVPTGVSPPAPSPGCCVWPSPLGRGLRLSLAGRSAGFIRSRRDQLCASSPRPRPSGGSSLNYRRARGLGSTQRVSSRGGAGAVPRKRHLQVTFPRVGAGHGAYGAGHRALCAEPGPSLPVCLFCFPVDGGSRLLSADQPAGPPLSVVPGRCCFSHIRPVCRENTPSQQHINQGWVLGGAAGPGLK